VKSDCKLHFLVRPRFDWHLPQVQNKMLAATHDLQVLDVVVEWVAVDVMHDLRRFERAAQVVLDNESVICLPLAVDVDVMMALVDRSRAWTARAWVVAEDVAVRLPTASSVRELAAATLAC
jgi:hypothetical protein